MIIVRARLLSIGPEYEEAAMDLGGSPTQSVRRVLLPLLYPAIFASAALVFADSLDDFVIVRYLSPAASSEPLSVKIYDAARAAPPPSVNAAATMMLVATLSAIGLAARGVPPFAEGSDEAERRISSASRSENSDGQLVLDPRLACERGRQDAQRLLRQEDAHGGPLPVRHLAATVRDPGLDRRPGREIHEHVQDRTNVDHEFDHPRHAVRAGRPSGRG